MMMIDRNATGSRLAAGTFAACLFAFAGVAERAQAQLFVGLEGSAPPTHSTDLAGFPDVQWTEGFTFDVSGAAPAPDGEVYLINGAFTTDLYRTDFDGPPEFLVTLDEDMHALAAGRGRLYGYSNFSDPKGIYEIDVDDLFYGYTEFGETGLYSINIDSGEMIKIADRIPASNGQGRGMAIGRNTVYLTATRGDDGIPYFAYDLSQGVGGEWTPFENPYPNLHSTGGAAYVAQPGFDISLNLAGECPGRLTITASNASPNGRVAFIYGRGEGSVKIPGGVCAGVELGLDRTAQLASVVQADNAGVAELAHNVPSGACGGSIFVQALDLETCSPSNVAPTP